MIIAVIEDGNGIGMKLLKPAVVLPPAHPEGDTTPHAHGSSVIWNPKCRWTPASLEHMGSFRLAGKFLCLLVLFVQFLQL